MRLGELLLQWDDVHFAGHTIHVARGFSGGRIETPKSGHGRTVDLSPPLAVTLRRLQVLHQKEKLRRGWKDVPAWLFVNEAGNPLDPSRVRKTFRRVLKLAGLPLHYTPHCLRHTFASLLLQQVESAQYVQEQLGHASITPHHLDLGEVAAQEARAWGREQPGRRARSHRGNPTR